MLVEVAYMAWPPPLLCFDVVSLSSGRIQGLVLRRANPILESDLGTVRFPLGTPVVAYRLPSVMEVAVVGYVLLRRFVWKSSGNAVFRLSSPRRFDFCRFTFTPDPTYTPLVPVNVNACLQQHARVTALVEASNWPKLWEADELLRELRAGRLLTGFQARHCRYEEVFRWCVMCAWLCCYNIGC